MKEITVQDHKSMMDNKEDFQLVDVRETYEYEICNIGGDLIPMGEVMSNLDKISKEKTVVVHCRSGGRSGTIVQFLESNGYTNVVNLKGGILAWADQVDPTLPKY
jgi:adenylyltransferase/sulfurtransferase